ncbi:MAG TPA: ATP-binding protein [Solirubrobacteraceae bacterium]|jgi:PAS domain S-box-containing protein
MDHIDPGQAPQETFLAQAEVAIVRLERAIREDRPASVAACAAHLHSASLDAGAALMAPIAAELEQRAQGNDLRVAAHLLAALERALVQTRAELDGALPQLLTTAPSPAAVEPLRAAELDRSSQHDRPMGRTGGAGNDGGPTPFGSWRPAPRWSSWIPLSALLAICVVIARLLSPADLSGLVTCAAAGVLVLAAVRLAATILADRRMVATMRATLESLRGSELQLALLFDHSPEPMWVYDRDSLRILAVSNAALAAYGYSREEFLAMKITDLRAPDAVPTLFDFLDTARGREHLGFCAADPWRHVRRDGTVIDVEVSSDDLLYEGRECRIVVSQDVTERNRATAQVAQARDQAVEASNLKSAFLATMSHEMRTPMQGVIGMNEMLLGTPLSDEQRSYADQIARSSEQMLAIVEDVLDIAALESGPSPLAVAPFDLRAALTQACAPAGVDAAAKDLHFGVVIGAEVPRLVRGDCQKLRRAVSKLVSNAVKFSDDGTVIVRVGAERAAGGWRVRVAVSDTGVGIESKSLESVFEPFAQADRSTTRQYGGVGLGLAIARELVELMGGTLCAESEPRRGSTFWFELEMPAADPRSPLDRPTMRRPRPIRRSRTPVVLLAEDSHINQIAAVRALRRYDCHVDVVADGAAALQALALKDYDAVLMDCEMPRLNGYEATARLRRGEYGRHTPVIAMTALERGEDETRCLTAGMDAAISKPMRPDALRETLGRWIPGLAEARADLEEPTRLQSLAG